MNMNSSENYDTRRLKEYTDIIGTISKNVNYINIPPMGVLAPLLSISLLLYTIFSFVKLIRKHRAERIVHNERYYRQEELELLERNRSVDKMRYILMLLVSLSDIFCFMIPIGPLIVTTQSQLVENFYQDKHCRCQIILFLMIKSIFPRLYISISKSAILTQLSLLRLLVSFITNVYRDRMQYTNFRTHFKVLAVKVSVIICLDTIKYTFIPNLIISLVILLIEYNYLRIGLKDLRFAAKMYKFELERDHPNEHKTREFKVGYNLYRILSPVLSFGIFNFVIAVVLLFNVMPICDFIANFNWFVHSIYHILNQTKFLDLSQHPEIKDLLYSILQLVQNLFMMLSTLSIVYPFTIFFTFFVANQLILYYRNKRSGYPTKRPELVTELLKWHRRRYEIKNCSHFNV